MAKYTFDWDSSEKKLKSLITSFEEYEKHEPSTFTALHLASESWHLTDWVFKEYNSVHGFSDIGSFRNDLFPRCESLKIMHDIANDSKHSEVSRPKTTIQRTERHNGDFAFEDYDHNDYDVSRLEIHLADGTVLNFENELRKTIDFWKWYFQNKLLISI